MSDVIATTTRIALEHLMRADPISLYELTMLCRDPAHELFGDCRQRLEALALLDGSGHVHARVREIVLASVQGDGGEMSLQ